jgi:peptidoglycan hydrolase CwlO-like protein
MIFNGVNMISLILIAIGILFLFLSIFNYAKFIKLIYHRGLKKWWLIILALIISFILGYSLYIYSILFLSDIMRLSITDQVVGLMFFFGSLFVLVSMRLIYHTLYELNKKQKELDDTVKRLEKEQLKKEEKIKKRTDDMEKLLKSMTGRELKMIELKKKIKELEENLPR